MALDDREQQILAEIERRFYEEDPDLVHAVRNIDRVGRFGVQLPLVGLVLGAVVTLAAFTVSTPVAAIGFAVMVVSATALVHGIRTRTGTVDDSQGDEARRGFRGFGGFLRR